MSKKEKVEGKKKGKKGIWLIILGVILVLGGVGAFFSYKYLKRANVKTETVSVSQDSEEFARYFKGYIESRLRLEELTEYGFRKKENEEILEELGEIREGLSKASRGVGSNYKGSEFEGIAEIISSDAAVLSKTVRELRRIETADYPSEADRQVDFMKASSENDDELRSEVFIARGAFGSEDEAINGKGILIFEGDLMVEVGGGVMNVLVGDMKKKVTAIFEDDLEGMVRRIRAEKLFGLSDGKLVQIGTGLREEMTSGKLVEKKVETGKEEATVTTTDLSVIGESMWKLKTRLNEMEIQGLVEEGGLGNEEKIDEMIELLGEKDGRKE